MFSEILMVLSGSLSISHIVVSAVASIHAPYPPNLHLVVISHLRVCSTAAMACKSDAQQAPHGE